MHFLSGWLQSEQGVEDLIVEKLLFNQGLFETVTKQVFKRFHMPRFQQIVFSALFQQVASRQDVVRILEFQVLL